MIIIFIQANILNKYFQSQTMLNETNAVPPNLTPLALNSELNIIVLTPLEVISVLKTLIIGKASGQMDSVIAFLKNSHLNFALLFVLSLISPYELVIVQLATRKQIYVLSLKKRICRLFQITVPYLCLMLKLKFLRGLFSNTYSIPFAIILYYRHCNLVVYRVIQQLIS